MTRFVHTSLHAMIMRRAFRWRLYALINACICVRYEQPFAVCAVAWHSAEGQTALCASVESCR